MSTVADLLLWDRNFCENRLGRNARRGIADAGVLNNGSKISDAMGLDLGSYRDLSIVEHSSGTFGNSTELLSFCASRSRNSL